MDMIGVTVAGGISGAGILTSFTAVSYAARKRRIKTATYAGCRGGADVTADWANTEDELSRFSASDLRHCQIVGKLLGSSAGGYGKVGFAL